MLTVRYRDPLIPVSVRVKLVPAASAGSMKTFMSEVAVPPAVVTVTGLGTKITVTPRSTERLLSVTLPVKLPRPVTVSLSELIPPDGIERDVEAAEMLKSLGAKVTVTGNRGAVEVAWLESPPYIVPILSVPVPTILDVNILEH